MRKFVSDAKSLTVARYVTIESNHWDTIVNPARKTVKPLGGIDGNDPYTAILQNAAKVIYGVGAQLPDIANALSRLLSVRHIGNLNRRQASSRKEIMGEQFFSHNISLSCLRYLGLDSFFYTLSEVSMFAKCRSELLNVSLTEKELNAHV